MGILPGDRRALQSSGMRQQNRPDWFFNLTVLPGHPSSLPDRWDAHPSRCTRIPSTAYRGNCFCRCSQRLLSRALELRDSARWRHIHCTRLVHRDVPHSTTGFCHHYAGCGQAQGDLSGACWDWPSLFCVRDDWYATIFIAPLHYSLAYHMFQVTISLGAL